jgi:hypothetical protein
MDKRGQSDASNLANLKAGIRLLFCIVGMLALVASAFNLAYGPRSGWRFDSGQVASGDPEAQPDAPPMTFREHLLEWWTMLKFAALIGAAVAIGFTLSAYKDQQQQIKYLQERLRLQLQVGER